MPLPSQITAECFAEDGGHEGVELGGGLNLQTFKSFHLHPQSGHFRHDPTLLGNRGSGNIHPAKQLQIEIPLRMASAQGFVS
jgi:hypothetical protein